MFWAVSTYPSLTHNTQQKKHSKKPNKKTPKKIKIHWFSIINSCVTVLLLTGFLATILMRVLRADFAKFSKDDGGDEDEAGWKYVHGDVFRFPPHKSLFCAFVGTGAQLLFLALSIFALALVGVFYPYNRGALFSALIFLYALTACIAGYVAASYYRQMDGGGWVRQIVLTAFVFCGPFFLVFCFLNTVAIGYRSTAALPFGASFFCWVFLLGCCLLLLLLCAVATDEQLNNNAPLIIKKQRHDRHHPHSVEPRHDPAHRARRHRRQERAHRVCGADAHEQVPARGN